MYYKNYTMNMPNNKFSFNLFSENSFARLGQINTSRGKIDTPTFMPVGTQATVKSTFIEDIAISGAQIILVDQISSVAEREGFEPSDGLLHRKFSKLVV